jgi:small ligand-binding sensory domain FIST
MFASASYGESLSQASRIIQGEFPQAVFVGCSGAGVLGGGIEIEDAKAVSVVVADLPNVRIIPFRADNDNTPSPDAPPEDWNKVFGVSTSDSPQFLVFMDNFSRPGSALLEGMDFAFPSSVKIGGLASGGSGPRTQSLHLNDKIYFDGAVGVALCGDIVVDPVVAQGCRPIGQPSQITKCQDNLLLLLDDETPISYLQKLFLQLDERDQLLMQGNLFLGIEVDPLQGFGEMADSQYLIRNLIGIDHANGFLAIGENLREGQRVQFHVRDSLTSHEDLEIQLSQYLRSLDKESLLGALMFQCNGRGRYLYGHPNHDSNTFRKLVGPIALGGFFCNGEIGPVGKTTYMHGYTSSFAVFRKP